MRRDIAFSHSADCAKSHRCEEQIIEEIHEMQGVGVNLLSHEPRDHVVLNLRGMIVHCDHLGLFSDEGSSIVRMGTGNSASQWCSSVDLALNGSPCSGRDVDGGSSREPQGAVPRNLADV